MKLPKLQPGLMGCDRWLGASQAHGKHSRAQSSVARANDEVSVISSPLEPDLERAIHRGRHREGAGARIIAEAMPKKGSKAPRQSCCMMSSISHGRTSSMAIDRHCSLDPDIVPVTHVATPADTCVNAHLGPVVLHRRPKYARILRQACLGKGRHHAPAAGSGYSKLHILTDAHGPSDPIIFDELRSMFCGLDQEVGSKAVQVKSPCGIELL